MKNWIKILPVVIVLFALSSAYSAACVGISQGYDWNNVKINSGEESYFSTRIYNTTTNGECTDAWYHIDAKFEDSIENVSDYFDYSFDNNRVYIEASNTKQILFTIKPKVTTGKYNIILTATRESGGMDAMMKYVFTASAKLVISVGDGTGEYSDVPFWTVRKDCNGGFVVEEGEPCPRVCPDGSVVLESLPCPVKQAPVKNEPIIKEENNNKPMFEGNETLIGAGIAILFVISLIGFKVFGKKKEENYGYYPQNPQYPQN